MIWVNLTFFINKDHFFSLMEDRKPIVFVLVVKAGYKYIIFSKINSRFSFFNNEMVIIKKFLYQFLIRLLFASFDCRLLIMGTVCPAIWMNSQVWLGPLSIMKQEWNVRLRPSWITGNSSLNSKTSRKGPQHQF